MKLAELFDDIYTPTARDGAAIREVHVRLQKALAALAAFEDPRFRIEAMKHSRLALQRAEIGLSLEEDKRAVRDAASHV
ncbi:hypothetical protein [Aliihoeflea sp. 40Bstr573]|uniref:hypothetical protein n=1 Tax=Aliihoeflea sp. 40Bstr573 TaxID=2696467 RepID=UPI00209512FE|nr:hypothetical protein [Aliihoeflea sp. 40Bstr573]